MSHCKCNRSSVLPPETRLSCSSSSPRLRCPVDDGTSSRIDCNAAARGGVLSLPPSSSSVDCSAAGELHTSVVLSLAAVAYERLCRYLTVYGAQLSKSFNPSIPKSTPGLTKHNGGKQLRCHTQLCGKLDRVPHADLREIHVYSFAPLLHMDIMPYNTLCGHNLYTGLAEPLLI